MLSDTLRYFLCVNRFKKELQKDNIDLGQWKINLQYLESKLDLVPTIDPTETELFLDKKTTSLVKAVKTSLIHYRGLTYPAGLYDIHPWILRAFVAAYPDVLDYFYPGRDFSIRGTNTSWDNADKQMRQTRQIVEKMLRSFNSKNPHGLSGKWAIVNLLFYMKDFYHKELGKKFLLSDTKDHP